MTTINGHKVGRIAEALVQVDDDWIRARILDGEKMFVRITIHEHRPGPATEQLDQMTEAGTSVKKEWLRELDAEPQQELIDEIEDVEDWVGTQLETLRLLVRELDDE